MTIFNVTSAQDIVDAHDGVLSLREAIEQANNTEADDTITFADDLADETLMLEDGSLQILDDLSIHGSNQIISIRGSESVLTGVDSMIAIHDVNFSVVPTDRGQFAAAIIQEGGSLEFTNGNINAVAGIGLQDVEAFSLENITYPNYTLTGLNVNNNAALQSSGTKGNIVNSTLPSAFITGIDDIEVQSEAVCL